MIPLPSNQDGSKANPGDLIDEQLYLDVTLILLIRARTALFCSSVYVTSCNTMTTPSSTKTNVCKFPTRTTYV